MVDTPCVSRARTVLAHRPGIFIFQNRVSRETIRLRNQRAPYSFYNWQDNAERVRFV